jgi:UDP-glucose 4-epimerase
MSHHEIAILGGAGFIGFTLANWLSERFDVRIIDKRRPVSLLGFDFDFVECDIRNYEEVKRSLSGADLAINAAIVQIPQVNDDKRLGYEVNVIGTQNVCEVVRDSSSLRGLLLTGSWHTIGERQLKGVIDERFGFRPDMVEDRARIYVLSKVAQESIVRLYDEESTNKIYGIIRIGTVLGDNMPEKTAARIFIDQALKGKKLTPYEHSMYRPMLYVNVRDVCRAFESYASMILNGSIAKQENSLAEIVNAYYPEPMTILELAQTIRNTVIGLTNGQLAPEVSVVRTGQPPLFRPEDKNKIKVDISRLFDFLGLENLLSPAEGIKSIIENRLVRMRSNTA